MTIDEVIGMAILVLVSVAAFAVTSVGASGKPNASSPNTRFITVMIPDKNENSIMLSSDQSEKCSLIQKSVSDSVLALSFKCSKENVK